jgi:hypothetical protein
MSETSKDFKLRDYQKDIMDKGVDILLKHNILYLAMEMRTGKTFTSMAIAESCNKKMVGFITKKKAMPSVSEDFETMDPSFNMVLINYESIHKVVNELKECDIIIIDEAQRLGGFPKQAKIIKLLKEICRDKPIIFMSGTPTPESYSQIYHQFFISSYSPFGEYKSFYKWSVDYVAKYQIKISGVSMNKYDRANENLIKEKTDHLFLSLTQKEAGFETEAIDRILKVPVGEQTNKLINWLKKNKYYELKKSDEIIICDTPAKLMSAVHQLSSGTIKIEDNSLLVDTNKIDYLKKHFAGKKIALFYKFVAFGNELKKAFPEWTSDQTVFNESTDGIYISQFISGREGVNLSTADFVIMCEIDHSATTYFQARMRGQSIDRKENIVYWLFSTEFEESVFKVISKKKKFTLNHFKREFL